MSPRDKFYEMISSLSNTVVNDDLFVISEPVAIDEIKTAVYLAPRAISNFYGARTVEYTRFNLSDLAPVSLQTQDEEYVHELIARLQRYNLFKYRINAPDNPSVTKTRFLTLAERDIVTAVVPRVFSQPVNVVLQAAPNSDFFVGSLIITLTPNI